MPPRGEVSGCIRLYRKFRIQGISWCYGRNANSLRSGSRGQTAGTGGGDEDLGSFAIALAPLSQDRPERGRMLVGLRGVGKTVLLRALSSEAVQRRWAIGWVEMQPDKRLGPSLARAIQLAMRPLRAAYRAHEALAHLVAVVRAFSLSVHLTSPWSVGLDLAPAVGIADTGQLDVDLPELFAETARTLQRLGVPGMALFLDELQDAAPPDLAALCMASHAVSQSGTHFMVVGAGLPHRSLQLADARSDAERLFEYRVVDRLDHRASRQALLEPARREGADFDERVLDRVDELSKGYPYFLQGYGKCAWDAAATSPIEQQDVEAGAPVALDQMDVGFFGTRYNRATPRERRPARHGPGCATGRSSHGGRCALVGPDGPELVGHAPRLDPQGTRVWIGAWSLTLHGSPIRPVHLETV